jgi:hypothetical protein
MDMRMFRILALLLAALAMTAGGYTVGAVGSRPDTPRG